VAAEAQTTGPPDFVGVGAQRAGTTWWFRTLVGHPQLRPARGRKKELHFFDRFCAREMGEEDVAAYHRLFPRRPGELAGEWTPRYMRDFWTPRLLRRAAPGAKLLVMLRDPIERYRSGVPHRLSRTPERERETLAVDAIDRSRYGQQLERLLRHYGPDEILVLQYEKCRADPAGEYRRTLRFLGVDSDHEPRDVERPRGTTAAAAKEPLWPDMLDCLHRALDPDVERLAELVDLDLSLWPNFAHLAAADGAAR
jgi:Sulfotransferase family